MSFGSVEMEAALNISAITSGLDSFTFTGGSGPALFSDVIIPQGMDVKSKTINYYMSEPYNAKLEMDVYQYTINCRAGTHSESKTIAKSVIDNINRVSYSNYYISGEVLPTIPPIDDRDNYNSVIVAKIFIT